MSSPLRFEPEARRELEDAALWYEERSAGLGGRFLDEVGRTAELVTRFPDAGGRVPGVRESLRVRRAPVDRFPYQLVYLESDDAIWVLAVAHDRRRPRYWLSRARSR